jgi:hypothetical protein
MSSKESPFVAYVLSLIGGVLILLGAVVGSFVTPIWYGGMMGRGWMMGGQSGWMMDNFGALSPLSLGFMVVSFVTGVLVIVGAVMMTAHPEQHMIWGTIVLIFSIVSFIGFGIGGFVLGALLGIAGGVLALSWRPPIRT